MGTPKWKYQKIISPQKIKKVSNNIADYVIFLGGIFIFSILKSPILIRQEGEYWKHDIKLVWPNGFQNILLHILFCCFI